MVRSALALETLAPAYMLVPMALSWPKQKGDEKDPPELRVPAVGRSLLVGRGFKGCGIDRQHTHISRRHAEVWAQGPSDEDDGGLPVLHVRSESERNSMLLVRAGGKQRQRLGPAASASLRLGDALYLVADLASGGKDEGGAGASYGYEVVAA